MTSPPLQRIRGLLRFGRLIAALLAVSALAATLWLFFGITDAFAAWESSARLSITAALVILTLAAFSALSLRSLRMSPVAAASLADDALADPRRPATAALSLSAESPSPLTRHLAQRTLDSTAQLLRSLPAKRLIPWKNIRIALALLAAPLLVTGVLRIAFPQAFATIASRLLHPAADIPPYSPLRFEISPSGLTAVYGGDLALTASIDGAPVTHPVECLVRKPGGKSILRLAAFRESPTLFTRQLDNLTEPVEIAFATGKARSPWQSVTILLEPGILSGLVKITPPAHTGLSPSSFPLDTNEIAAIEGSSVTLELTSNRPLSAGTLTFTPAAIPGSPSTPSAHFATIPSLHTAAFTWTATSSGHLSALVRDLLGTPSPRPLELTFRNTPDNPPVVDLLSPPRMLLATPESVIPVKAAASDDFALSRVQLVRTLSGFRDRIRTIAPALNDKNHDYSGELDLSSLGVRSGDTLELMVEASDHNPSLLGHGSSELARIRIISREEYAEYIRNKTTIAEFSARFSAVNEALRNTRESLEQLRENPSDETLQSAREAHEEAAALLEKIAADFPAFEIEKRLQDLASRQAETLRDNLRKLDSLPAPETIDALLAQLGRHQPEADILQQDVAQINKAASLLEMAARFQQIYQNQESLAKRYRTIVDEIRHGQDQNRRLLPSLAETQTRNREALDRFLADLRLRAGELADNPELSAFARSALDFADELELAAPSSLMDAASTYSKAGNALDAFTNAELAHAVLERLMAPSEPFPQACRGQSPSFNIPRPDANQTIGEMLSALMCQNPGTAPNQGTGAGGMGAGGFGPSGTAMGGFSIDLPVIGPDRLHFDPISTQTASATGAGDSGKTTPLPTEAETGSITPSASRSGESGISPESIPEPYREAVKRYFTP